MIISNIEILTDTDFKKSVQARVELPLPLQQNHFSTFHANDYYESIGRQLIESLKTELKQRENNESV